MKVTEITRELDLAQAGGPLKDIIIPPCPALLAALQKEINKADPDPGAIARIAGKDVAMAAALIRFANSPLFTRARPVATVHEAVVMLGVGQTVAILTGFLVRKALPANTPQVAHFWETSARRAIAMGYIARQLYGMDPDLAQTCGLFCHVGIPVMLQGIPGYGATLTDAMLRQDRGFTQIENDAHRADHAVVGAIVAKTWRLPTDIAIAVRLHHDFTALHDSTIPVQVRNLIAIAALAEHLVSSHEGLPEQKQWAKNGADCLAYLQVGTTEVDAWSDTLHIPFSGVVVG